jgi:hypothetical protein
VIYIPKLKGLRPLLAASRIYKIPGTNRKILIRVDFNFYMFELSIFHCKSEFIKSVTRFILLAF